MSWSPFSIQEHITRLGPDPERVLVFGQSGGAINTCTMLASPLAKGLFSSALMQSGLRSCRTLEASQAQHDEGVDVIEECRDTADRLACLRALPFDRAGFAVPGSIAVGTGAAST